MELQSCWSRIRHWVDMGTERLERMWLREGRAAGRRAAGEHRWTWIWLGRDATESDIEDVVRQVDSEVVRLPAPLGIGDFMVTVTIWGPRRDGRGETLYLEAKQAGHERAMQEDLALREGPKVVAIGDVARGHVIDWQSWNSGAREQLRRTLLLHRPSRRWRIVHISLFSVGEAYLKLVAQPATSA